MVPIYKFMTLEFFSKLCLKYTDELSAHSNPDGIGYRRLKKKLLLANMNELLMKVAIHVGIAANFIQAMIVVCLGPNLLQAI